jgi:antitoxin YefM
MWHRIPVLIHVHSPHARHYVTNLRKNLAAALDGVNDDHELMIITREGGKPSAVLMSLEDFASWQETNYLLRNPANAARLLESIAELEAGKGVERTLIE